MTKVRFSVFLFFLFTIIIKTSSAEHEAQVSAAESRRFTGATLTSHNSRMKGHVIASLIARSQIACAQACRMKPRCVSTNYELGSLDGGLCELNNHRTSMGAVKKGLDYEEGFVYSQFVEEDCQMTGCLHGGSCLFDKNNQEFSCFCTLRWTGKNCEVKRALEFSFTTLNSSGKQGPTSNTGYKGSLLENVTVTNGLQRWRVPLTGWYYVEICGASGGDGSAGKFGGKGAKVNGTVFLKKGTLLIVLVGQQGSTLGGVGQPGSGGGGSFVAFASNSTPLSIAGGGGGGGSLSGGGPGQAGEAEGLKNSSVGQGGVGCVVGGTGFDINDGGPGGGWDGDGQCYASAPCNTKSCNEAGKSFKNGGTGGLSSQVNREGGFGGGGACEFKPGAGGGYSGGSVFYEVLGGNPLTELTGGGGSFVLSDTWGAVTGGCDRGDGYVKIRLPV